MTLKETRCKARDQAILIFVNAITEKMLSSSHQENGEALICSGRVDHVVVV